MVIPETGEEELPTIPTILAATVTKKNPKTTMAKEPMIPKLVPGKAQIIKAVIREPISTTIKGISRSVRVLTISVFLNP